MGEVHPHLRGISSLKFESPSASEVAERCDVVFTAVPHGTAMDWVPELLDAGAKVVDLSADYRLPLEVFEKMAFEDAVKAAASECGKPIRTDGWYEPNPKASAPQQEAAR